MTGRDQLATDCAQVASTAESVAGWFSEYRDKIGVQAPAMRKSFRRHRMLARRYERAARRPMCVGVFGESQSGKSYLISALARRGQDPVEAVFAGQPIRFLDLNPESGNQQEATGLVTRFSIRPCGAPSSHPVALRLLSQTDLVKILANAYLLDFTIRVERPPEEAAIQKALAEARNAAGNAPVDPLTEDDIEDLRDYFNREFEGRATAKVLEDTLYWSQLEELAPRLAPPERVKLYQLLWGSNPVFTEVYKQLYAALAELGFADEASTTLDAIADRKDTILSVQALKGLIAPSGNPIEVLARNGRRARLSRGALAAIIAELVVELRQKPADYFEHTDLLDFPGLRSRLELQMAPEEYLGNGDERADKMQELFRRGKVAYLFDRYCEEEELTSMLLCVQPGNQNCRVLPPMVMKWVHATHGADPARRDRVETALFMTLTKFDLNFTKSDGKKEDEASLTELWTKAIDTPLLDFFGKDKDNWPKEWQTGRAFDNVIWIRNPGYEAPWMIVRQGSTETGIVEPQRIESYRQAYLRTPLVAAHVRDADAAWNAAMVLNDGGVTYLAQRLAPLCRPDLKTQQIQERLVDLQRLMRREIDSFYVSEDGAEERRKRVAASTEAAHDLAMVAEQLRFGHFLSDLQIERGLMQQALFWANRPASGQQGPIGPKPNASRLREMLFGGKQAAGSPPPLPAGDPRAQLDDPAAQMAERALEVWAERLRKLSQDERRMAYLTATPAAIATVTRELLEASVRLNLIAVLANDVRALTNATEGETAGVVKPAMACAERINTFVQWLGQDQIPEKDRARRNGANGEQLPVFAAKARIDRLDELPENLEPHFETFIGEWLSSFMSLTERNTLSGASEGHTEHNRKLGAIRSQLAS